VSHETQHAQFLFHTSATALRNEAAVDRTQQGGGARVASLGQLLSRIEGQTLKTCDMDSGMPLPPHPPAQTMRLCIYCFTCCSLPLRLHLHHVVMIHACWNRAAVM